MIVQKADVSASVRYNVSDFLKDRLPYKDEDGFAAMRVRDKGKVFDAAAPFNVTQWLSCLQTCALDVNEISSVNDEHVKAMQYIWCYSKSQQAKLRLLRQCIIQRLVALLGRLQLLQSHNTSTLRVTDQVLQLQLLIFQCFNSFAAIPQGNVQLVQFLAAAAAIRVLYRLYGVQQCQLQQQQQKQRQKDNNKRTYLLNNYEQQHTSVICQIKVAALQLLCSLSSNMIGRQCLLRGKDNEANSAKIHFAVKQTNNVDNMYQVCTNVNIAECNAFNTIQNEMPSHLVHCVCCVLQDVLHVQQPNSTFSNAAICAMEIMNFSSIEKEGVEAFLHNKQFVVVLKHCLLRVSSIASSFTPSSSYSLCSCCSTNANSNKTSPEQLGAKQYEQFAGSMFGVVWNVAMDAQGVITLEQHHFPDLLFVLFDNMVCSRSATQSSIQKECAKDVNQDNNQRNVITIACKLQRCVSFKVQRHLIGALCALHKLTSVKLATLDSCKDASSSSHNRLQTFLLYLSQLNILVDWNRTTPDADPHHCNQHHANNNHGNKSTFDQLYSKKTNVYNYDDLVAISKNTVQCIRFASQVQSVRVYMHNYLKWLQTTSPVEAFYLRRQLYFGTKWQAEFDANV